jgi:hypothetical protein
MAKKKAAWTVIVYLAGDNNLTTECMFALTEMKKAEISEEVNVIAQFDPSDPYLPAHRYEINRSKDAESLYSDIIDRARFYKDKGEVNFKKESRKANSLAQVRRKARRTGQAKLEKASLTAAKVDKVVTDETDTGSPITLYNFISFCLEEYPAERYMVVLSGHAGGTERDYLLKDESPAGSLTFNELKQVFKRVKKDRGGKLIDIVGMDNCLMSMAEICYELKEVAEIVVGCESFSPTSGWPYRQILERLGKDFVDTKLPKGQSTTAEAAKAIVDEYVNYYSTYWIAGLSVTQSALNVKKVGKLQREVNKLAREMEQRLLAECGTKAASRPAPTERRFESSLLLAHWEAQSYNGEQFVDLFDFCDCLEKRVEPGPITEQCREIKKFIETQFVLKSCYCGAAYQYSYGVSMYFPWAQIAPTYWNLDFVNQTKGSGWGNFLKTYTRLTRRLPRGWERAKSARTGKAVNTESRNASTDHRMISDRMISDRMISDRMISDRMGSALNRIHSMRNPPDIFLPDECIKDRRKALESQEILRMR